MIMTFRQAGDRLDQLTRDEMAASGSTDYQSSFKIVMSTNPVIANAYAGIGNHFADRGAPDSEDFLDRARRLHVRGSDPSDAILKALASDGGRVLAQRLLEAADLEKE